MTTVEKVTAAAIVAFLVLVTFATCDGIEKCNQAGGTWHRGACYSKEILIR